VKYQRKGTVESAPLKDETILYDASTVRFCVLNDTASFVWNRLDAPRFFDDLLNEIVDVYHVDDHAVEQDLEQVLNELTRLAFISSDSASDSSEPNAPRMPTPDHSTAPPLYRVPTVRMMDESEVLAAFQVTSAGLTWWTM
jgi:hypothetical protein